ncbi:hypothetical protein Desaci_2212 [Desulfosporosinus acidiphilus SJ4]|uniref:Uncharacterized protein n=1 Tax=Desulfosporosinus acidiphilus (strain DSM 22704 / JCM 16185 / SJ4) TaxID=646529 RepID=I4D5U9_DESAJ|nr:hypothetical protein [Desulfosporosinus acidiphilus]AFM41173.1 hypothetical protein Desaci_2212 [Desulfosporosinus acidiphilus SJ4]
METLIAGLALKQLIIIILGILVVGFILKKLFKLAITMVIFAALIYYGLPLLQTTMGK